MTTIDPALEDLIVYPPSESKSPTTSGGEGWRTTSGLPASTSASEDTTQAHQKALAHSQINQNQTVSPSLPEADAATPAVTHVQRNPRTIPETTNTPNASNSIPGGPKRRTRGGNAASAAAPYPNPSSLTGVTTSSPAASSTPLQLDQQMLQNSGNLPRTSCPQPTGKIKNQLQARKSIAQALADCGDDQALRHAVLAAVNCEEYRQNKAVPAQYLTPLTETVGLRAQSRCRFPGCGKMSVRTDRAKEHARVHIGNHPYSCERIQADGRVGCGATFLRKHDRNRHNAGADLLTCDACGANIQGKGREYNLQRHRSNYCPVIKAQKAAGVDTLIPPGILTAASMPTQVGPGSGLGPGPSKRGRKNQQGVVAHGMEGEMETVDGDEGDGDMIDMDGEAEDEDGDGDMA